MELISQLKFVKETVEKNKESMTKEDLIKRIDEVIEIVREYFKNKDKPKPEPVLEAPEIKESKSQSESQSELRIKKPENMTTLCHL